MDEKVVKIVENLFLDLPCIKKLYNFENMCLIGSGGFGAVYKCQHRNDNQMYAVKFIPYTTYDPDGIIREVDILASLNHRNMIKYCNSFTIVSAEDFGIIFNSQNDMEDIAPHDKSSEGDLYEECPSTGDPDTNSKSLSNDSCSFVRELPDTNTKSLSSGFSEYDACLIIQTELIMKEEKSQSLETIIESKKIYSISAQDRYKMFEDIVLGVNHIHDKGIMHRDLKPDNILTSENNLMIIADFGLARRFMLGESSSAAEKDSNCFSQDVGTPSYMAPEVKESTVYDKKADCYSLGLILFKMFYEEPINTSSEDNAIWNMLRNQEFIKLKMERCMPSRYRLIPFIVENLVRKEPNRRLQCSGILYLMTMEYRQSDEKCVVGAQISNYLDVEYHGPVKTLPIMYRRRRRSEPSHGAFTERVQRVLPDSDTLEKKSTPAYKMKLKNKIQLEKDG